MSNFKAIATTDAPQIANVDAHLNANKMRVA